MLILFPLLCLLGIASSSSLHGPLTTDGRWIKDAHGDTVTFTGTNWPGHLEPMIPEGLQYQSYKNIIQKIKSVGMNAIRLTFAIEMVDEIFERNGTDVTLKETFIGALGVENGTKILGQVLKKNKDFTEKTTRLEVFGAIAKELARNGMYLHLDNHVSKAQWCCGDTDGNSWFGDVYFDVAKWQRGLAYLAAKADEWPSLMSIGMRNELRKENRDDVSLPYDFLDWYTHMTAAATAIHTANPNILIFFSGLNYSETVAPVPLGLPLLPNNPNSTIFRPTNFPWSDKMVLEIHVYTMSDRINTSNCLEMKKALYKNGFNALDEMNPEVVYPMPVVMSEFGFAQNATMWQSTYAQCLKEFLPERKAGWMNWAVAGSYYTRSGTQDMDDSWGLLTHDWSEWRNEVVMNEYYRPFVKET